MKPLRSFSLALLAAAAAFSQARPEFEVASIRPSADQGAGQVGVGLHIDGAQVRCNYLSLKDYVVMAYRLKFYQVSGPEWIASQRFDIAATLPSESVSGQVPEMLQALLADRFAMKLHRETKEFPVYGLEVLKSGLKAKESAPDSTAGEGGPGRGPVDIAAGGSQAGVGVNLGGGSYFTFGNNHLQAKKLSMATLADTLARFTDRPVVDMTGVAGNFDFDLEITPEDYQAMLIRSAIAAGVTLPPQALRALDNSSGDSLAAALQKAGLKLEPRKAPLEVLVVDSALKTPTDN